MPALLQYIQQYHTYLMGELKNYNNSCFLRSASLSSSKVFAPNHSKASFNFTQCTCAPCSCANANAVGKTYSPNFLSGSTVGNNSSNHCLSKQNVPVLTSFIIDCSGVIYSFSII